MACKARMILDLTKAQQAAIAPLLQELAEANQIGGGMMIVAQVFTDHIVIGTATGPEMKILSYGKGEVVGARDRRLPTVGTSEKAGESRK